LKPFKINRNSWHYKLNKNFFNGNSMFYAWEPKHNNFCSYWRATMFRMVFATALSLWTIAVVALFSHIAYTQPIEFLSAIGVIVGFFLLIVGVNLTIHVITNRNEQKSDKPDSLFVQKYKAHKSKICPKVEYDQ
jgi:uncharacterized membrane protein